MAFSMCAPVMSFGIMPVSTKCHERGGPSRPTLRGPGPQNGADPRLQGRSRYHVSCAPNFTNRASRMFTGTCHAGP